MTINMTIELGILIAIIGVCLSVSTFFIGRQSAAKKSGEREGVLNTNMEYLKKAVDDIKSEQKEIKSELKEANLSALKSAMEEEKKRGDKQDESISRLQENVTRINQRLEMATK